MSATRVNPIYQEQLSTTTITSGLFTPANGITVTGQTISIYGKVCSLELHITHTAAWTVGTQYNIGTIASGYRPSASVGGIAGTYGVSIALTTGAVYVRPLYATETAAGSSTYVRFFYILP